MTTKTIQEKLNNRASTKLHGELCNIFRDFRNALRLDERALNTMSLTIARHNDEPVRIKASTLLSVLQKTIHSVRLEKREQMETDAFLTQIDNLGKDVERAFEDIDAIRGKPRET